MKGSPDAHDPTVELRPHSTEPHRGWTVRTSTGSAQRFHDVDPDPGTGHEIWVHRVDRAAVIFGSTQVPGVLDVLGERQGNADSRRPDPHVEVCRRRSGGGLVIVQPDDVWIDAVVPRHSPLHHDDVGRAFHWFGQVWLEALRPLLARSELDEFELCLAKPPPGRSAAGRTFFCFADIGHGEVLRGDRKVVGISQRRTRNWTRLQSLLVSRWEPGRIEELVTGALDIVGHDNRDRASLGGPPYDAADVRAGLAADGWPAERGLDTMVQAVLRHLPVVDAVSGSDPVS